MSSNVFLMLQNSSGDALLGLTRLSGASALEGTWNPAVNYL
jgi:hypothetical protein